MTKGNKVYQNYWGILRQCICSNKICQRPWWSIAHIPVNFEVCIHVCIYNILTCRKKRFSIKNKKEILNDLTFFSAQLCELLKQNQKPPTKQKKAKKNK